MKATPTSPTLTAAHVTENTGLIVSEQLVLLAPSASLTCTEKEPPAVGVPVMAPVVVFSIKPAGNVPTIENV